MSNFQLLKRILNRELDFNLHLFQGVPKSFKMDIIIQKCTELGANSITPVLLNRCISNKKNYESKIKKIPINC